MEGVTSEPLFEQEPKVAPAPAVPEEAPLRFSLILESRHRALVKREILALKKGKSRKISKKDQDYLEEQMRLFYFDPVKFLDRHLSQFMPSEVMNEINKEEESSDVKAEETVEPVMN